MAYNKVYIRNRSQELRLRILEHYSNGTMMCIGHSSNVYSQPEHIVDTLALTIDHIHAEPRKWNYEVLGYKRTGLNLACYSKIIKLGYPVGLQVLCMNCNRIKGSHITSKGFNTKDRSHITVEFAICNKCGITKPQYEFHLGDRNGLQRRCMECQLNELKKQNIKRKLELMNILGINKCVDCGESRFICLSFEHGNDADGHRHRKEIQDRYKLNNYRYITGHILVRYVLKDIKAGHPIWPGLTVCCHNCNEIRRKQMCLNKYNSYLQGE